MKQEEKKLLKECEFQAFRSRGKGGQHVAKTDSAVRLIHVPTGIAVSSDQERSQYLNKKICLEKLQKKLKQRMKKKKIRIPTKKSKGVKAKIRKEKMIQSEKKRRRHSAQIEDL